MRAKLILLILCITFIQKFANSTSISKSVCLGDSVKIGIKNLPFPFSDSSHLVLKWNNVIETYNHREKKIRPLSDTIYILTLNIGTSYRYDTFRINVKSPPDFPGNKSNLTYFTDINCFSNIDLNKKKKDGEVLRWSYGYNDSIFVYRTVKDTIVSLQIAGKNGCLNNFIVNVKPRNAIQISFKKGTHPKVKSDSTISISNIDTLFSIYNVKQITKINYYRGDSSFNKMFKIYCEANVDSLHKKLLDYPEILLNVKILGRNTSFNLSSPTAPGLHPNDFYNPYTSVPHALAAMRIPEAWTITQGNPNMQIGIVEIDAYPNINHEDLMGKVHRYGTIVPSNIFSQHATRVAGIITANTNNGIGVCGIGNKIEVSAFAINNVNYSDYNEVLNLAYSSGIRILNFSHVTDDYDIDIQNLLNTYANLGMIFVGGASNEYQEKDWYPASYDNVISVGGCATDIIQTNPSTFVPGDNFPVILNNYSVDFSKIVFEPTQQTFSSKIDICATSKKFPTTGGYDNEDIYNYQYVDGDGTSFASPAVAAIIGLMLSVNPCLDNVSVEKIIKETARPISDNIPSKPFYGKLGAGFIDAKAALDLALNYGNQTLTITNGQTITIENENKTFTNIIVQSGGVLWINNSIINIKPDGIVNIKQGGKLFSRNSTFQLEYLKTICNDHKKWFGIMIEGNKNTEQSDLSTHGFCNLQEVSVYNADNAILVGNGNSGGGVLIANKCNFNVIKHGIYFFPYSSPSLQNNRSFISNCTFQILSDFPTLESQNAKLTQVGITASHVKGLRIMGCRFYGEENFFLRQLHHTPIGDNSFNRDAIGIESFNSSIIISKIESSSFPTNTPEIKPEFRELTKGIYHTGISPIEIVYINNSNFYKCGKGIEVEGGNVEIYKNKFTIYDLTSDCDYIIKQIAIFLNNINGGKIANNEIVKSPDYSTDFISLCPMNQQGTYYLGSDLNITNDLIPISNIFSQNSYSFYMKGAQFEGINDNTICKCNLFSKHLDGIVVFGMPPFFGKCTDQDQRIDLGNKFENILAYNDVLNSSSIEKSREFDFLSSDINVKKATKVWSPSGYKISLYDHCYQPHDIPVVNCIPIIFESGPGYGNSFEYDNAKPELNLKKTLLKNGSSNGLLQDVIFVSKSNSKDVYDELFQNSPYLGDDILFSFISKSNFFTPEQVMHILVANSKLTDSIYDLAMTLDFLTENNEFLFMLNSAQYNESNRRILINEIEKLTRNIEEFTANYVDSCIYLFVYDTLNNSGLHLENISSRLLSNEYNGEYDFFRYLIYSKLGITDSMGQIINRMPSSFEKIQLLFLDNFVNTIKSGLADSTYLINNLQTLVDFAIDTTTYFSKFSNGICKVLLDTGYQRYPWNSIDNETLNKKGNLQVENNYLKNADAISIFPNPSKGIINVVVDKNNSINKVSIFNSNGTCIKTINAKLPVSKMENIEIVGNTEIVYVLVKLSNGKLITRKILLEN